MRNYRFAMMRLCGLALMAAACSSSDAWDIGPAPGTNSEALDSGRGAAGGPSRSTDPVQLPRSVTLDATGTFICGGEPCQCNNGIDDDGDGKVDGFDAECTGGIDDDEATFATGIPGDNRDPKWQDCFFDGNSGAGDDRCRYPTECLTGELAEEDPACAVTQACLDNCLPRTPNGCDCFGCCAVQLPGGDQVHVTLSDTCSLELIGDADACTACTPSADCNNECGECELCPGRTLEDLPPSCSQEPEPPAPEPPVVEPTCDGLTACAESVDCGSGEFCSMGCCLAVIR